MSFKQITSTVIMLTLFFYGVINSLIYIKQSEDSLSVIRHNYSTKSYKQSLPVDLDNVSTIAKANFTSKSDNLGIVAIRFNNHSRVNHGQIEFRIKEVGTDEWYYKNIYNTDQFRLEADFTFGFPLIKDSKNKKYEIEIQPTYLTPLEYVSIPKGFPIITKHQYDSSEIKNNYVTLTRFLIIKALNTVSDIRTLLAILSYFTPWLIYVIIRKLKKPPFAFLTDNTFIWLLIIILVGSQDSELTFIVSSIVFAALLPASLSSKVNTILLLSILSLPLVPLVFQLSNYVITQRLYGRIYLIILFSVIYFIFQLKKSNAK